ncbi:MAG: hypothetical protein J6Y64_00550 [Ruminococcus sp.]|nr:hypothetical protein [Ruminococcus sp.]
MDKKKIVNSLNVYLEMMNCPLSDSEKNTVTSWAHDLINGDLISLAEKEYEPMEHADRIEITFKSGETISYGKGEWDDYSYDGKAVIIKQKGAWIGIYNFDHVFCVELKEN